MRSAPITNSVSHRDSPGLFLFIFSALPFTLSGREEVLGEARPPFCGGGEAGRGGETPKPNETLALPDLLPIATSPLAGDRRGITKGRPGLPPGPSSPSIPSILSTR